MIVLCHGKITKIFLGYLFKILRLNFLQRSCNFVQLVSTVSEFWQHSPRFCMLFFQCVSSFGLLALHLKSLQPGSYDSFELSLKFFAISQVISMYWPLKCFSSASHTISNKRTVSNNVFQNLASDHFYLKSALSVKSIIFL